MPPSVLIKSVFLSVLESLSKKREEIPACPVPNRVRHRYRKSSSLNSVINMVVVIKVGLFNQVFTDEEPVIPDTTIHIEPSTP